MIVIIDYNVGNLKSVVGAFKRIGLEAVVSRDEKVIKEAKGIVLPGVGTFPTAMKNLEKYTNVFVENLQITAEQCKGLQYQGVELWDSVGHMTLVAALEDVFDVMLETDDIVDLSSFEKGMDILQKYNVSF